VGVGYASAPFPALYILMLCNLPHNTKKRPPSKEKTFSKEIPAEQLQFSACGSNKREEAEAGGTDDPAGREDRAWQSAGQDVLESAWFVVLAGLPKP